MYIYQFVNNADKEESIINKIIDLDFFSLIVALISLWIAYKVFKSDNEIKILIYPIKKTFNIVEFVDREKSIPINVFVQNISKNPVIAFSIDNINENKDVSIKPFIESYFIYNSEIGEEFSSYHFLPNHENKSVILPEEKKEYTQYYTSFIKQNVPSSIHSKVNFEILSNKSKVNIKLLLNYFNQYTNKWQSLDINYTANIIYSYKSEETLGEKIFKPKELSETKDTLEKKEISRKYKKHIDFLENNYDKIEVTLIFDPQIITLNKNSIFNRFKDKKSKTSYMNL